MNRAEMKRRAQTLDFSVMIAIVIALAIQNSSCLLVNTDTVVCAETGMRCPAGWTCTQEQDGCTQDGCGDGIKTQGEECDDGNVHGGDGCSPDCHIEVCGNGMKDLNEECDDNNLIDGDGCNSKCLLEICGNGVLDTGEECDTRGESSGCNANCRFSRCGDGVLNAIAGEKCDTGGIITADCNGLLCTLPRCGDNFTNPMAGEECDTGSIDTRGCNGKTCVLPACGDSYLNKKYMVPEQSPDHSHNEECDDGRNTVDCNGNDNDNGVGNCMKPTCGDRYFNPEYIILDDSMNHSHHEECDTGNNTTDCNGHDNTNGVGNCAKPSCGDGYINSAFKPNGSDKGEECDPGNINLGIPSAGCRSCGLIDCRCH